MEGTGKGGESRGREGTRPHPFTPPIHISGYAPAGRDKLILKKALRGLTPL